MYLWKIRYTEKMKFYIKIYDCQLQRVIWWQNRQVSRRLRRTRWRCCRWIGDRILMLIWFIIDILDGASSLLACICGGNKGATGANEFVILANLCESSTRRMILFQAIFTYRIFSFNSFVATTAYNIHCERQILEEFNAVNE